jgi:hypothetical protein
MISGAKIVFAAGLALLSSVGFAQPMPGPKAPSVAYAAPALVNVARGSSGTVDLHFRVSPGFHINSNTPHAEYLIATNLKLDPPTDIVIGKVTYPPGEDMSFPFAPNEKVNVYTGDFEVNVKVRPLHSVLPGKYAMHGILKYQACDNAQCYPPKQLPISFYVKGTPGPVKHNPAQSPHAHS